ncbi:hypothetical protein [Vibrio chagasii]|uniref:hypothetical protein n=1 Tax=Vibrio chagasii TaxID=170679 RepID=UPI003DA1335C
MSNRLIASNLKTKTKEILLGSDVEKGGFAEQVLLELDEGYEAIGGFVICNSQIGFYEQAVLDEQYDGDVLNSYGIDREMA